MTSNHDSSNTNAEVNAVESFENEGNFSQVAGNREQFSAKEHSIDSGKLSTDFDNVENFETVGSNENSSEGSFDVIPDYGPTEDDDSTEPKSRFAKLLEWSLKLREDPEWQAAQDSWRSTHNERCRKIEELHPEVILDRSLDGEYLDWGMCPEQALGTFEGNPFYYRMRGNYATFEVWEAESVKDKKFPTWEVDPILFAENPEVIENDVLVGSTEDSETFLELLEALEPFDRKTHGF